MGDSFTFLLAAADEKFLAYLHDVVCSEPDFAVVGQACSGTELLRLALMFRPHVIISDVTLRQLDGITALSELNEKLRCERPAELFMSAYASSYIGREIASSGADFFLLKDVSRRELLSTLRRLAIGAKLSAAESIEQCLLEYICGELHSLGMPSSLDGFRYALEGIKLGLYDESLLRSVTRKLYPEIARRCNSRPPLVERSLRTAITTAWDRGSLDTLQSIFGYTVSGSRGRPTNAEFISMLAERAASKFPQCRDAEAI